MIVYPRNTVTYLRNNQAVSWPGFEPATASHKSNVLTITPPSHLPRGGKRRVEGEKIGREGRRPLALPLHPSHYILDKGLAPKIRT